MTAISKSGYIRGLKCPKALYLHYCQPEARDEIGENQQNVFDTGHHVGRVAQMLFPGGTDASRGEPGNYADNIAFTSELISDGQKVIYEAAFGDGETLCYLDILAEIDGMWQAFEVKATSRVKEYHFHDAAFQYYVITRCGLPLTEISIVHLNNQYVRRGELDIPHLFVKHPVTRAIRRRQAGIPVKLAALQQMLAAGSAPEIAMGGHCKSPYTCNFISFCMAGREFPNPVPDLFPANRNQAELDAFRAGLEYPLFFLDFETFMPAIPLYNENRPYQNIPFQYSLHVQRDPGSEPEHLAFLATPPVDPRREFISTLLGRLGGNGSIVVWNQAFEKGILRELARDLPEFHDRIEPLFPRIADLMVPFRRKHLYTPEMNGSFSLKAVLPAIVPELSYACLGISDGNSASVAYASLYHEPDPEVIHRIRHDLLEYCMLDTLSMVRILARM